MFSRSSYVSTSRRSLLAFVVFVVVAGVSSGPSVAAAAAGGSPAMAKEEETGRKMSPSGLDCERSRFSVDCLKLELVTFLEKMSEAREYQIGGGLSIVQDATVNRTKNADIVADMARSFPSDPESRLNGFLLAKVSSFLQSHTLNVKLLSNNDLAEARSAMDSRKMKKKGGMEGIIAAALMMKSMLMALSMGALALLAGKALIAALMALMLAALNGFKSLTSKTPSSTTYEIITRPSHMSTHSSSHDNVHEHSGGGTGYGRSMSFELPEHLQNGVY